MPAKTKRHKQKTAKKRRVIQPKQFVAEKKLQPLISQNESKTPSITSIQSNAMFFKKDFTRSFILTIIILTSIVSLYGLQERGIIDIAGIITFSAQ